MSLQHMVVFGTRDIVAVLVVVSFALGTAIPHQRSSAIREDSETHQLERSAQHASKFIGVSTRKRKFILYAMCVSISLYCFCVQHLYVRTQASRDTATAVPLCYADYAHDTRVLPGCGESGPWTLLLRHGEKDEDDIEAIDINQRGRIRAAALGALLFPPQVCSILCPYAFMRASRYYSTSYNEVLNWSFLNRNLTRTSTGNIEKELSCPTARLLTYQHPDCYRWYRRACACAWVHVCLLSFVYS